SVDWQMSLDPLCRSTIYGMVNVVGQAFGAWAFTLLFVGILIYVYKTRINVPKKTELDLGNILLTLVILSAYLSFMQHLIVWSGNRREGTPWFWKRMRHGWEWIFGALFLFQFAAPFSGLLFRDVKESLKAMVIITLSVLVVRVLDRYWMIMPSFSPDGISVS